MSIFDKLWKKTNDEPNVSAERASEASFSASEVFSFASLPESLEELKALTEAAMDTPHKTAALTVCALCAYAADKDIGIAMMNFLLGPRPLNNFQKSFLKDRFSENKYVPFSYFEGAIPENDYTPDIPFKITVEAGAYSDANAGEGYKKLYIRSGGADSPREVVLRRSGDGKWYLWEQFLLMGIRKGKSEDPWA